MYHTVKVKNKKYIFFTNAIELFEYNEKIDEFLKIGALDEQTIVESGIQKYFDRDAYVGNKIEEFLKNQYEIKHEIGACDINVFYGCNLQCQYCFANGGNHGKKGGMSPEIVEKTVDFILINASRDDLDVTVVGGEPTLNIPAIEKIINYGKEQTIRTNKKIYYSMITNGTLLSEKVSDLIIDNKFSLMISLDSNDKKINNFLRESKDGKSTYDAVKRNLSYIKSNGDVNINVTVTPYNLNISEIATELFNQGVTAIHFGEVVSDKENMQFTKSDIDILKKEYEKLVDLLMIRLSKGEKIRCYPLMTFLEKIHNKRPLLGICSVLKNRCAFSPEGNIYPCDIMMYDSYCIGNIKEGFFEEKIQELNKTLMDEGHCKDCWARFLCGGECLSTKLWNNTEQKILRCELKRHICALKLYLYDYIVKNVKELIPALKGGI